MSASDGQNRESEAQRRLSLLSAASLRINESLDFDVVLQVVVDSARALTDSRYAALTVAGQTDEVPEFVVSGLTRQEHRGLWELPEGLAFLEYLSGLDEPLRVADIDGHLRSLGMPEFLPSVTATALLVAPIRHGGVGVGTIYLAHREQGREFTVEDENVLTMFASQAALVIANARRYRDEQRARNDLAALVDISPVGIVTFDATTAAPVSFNREAVRIVESLRDPGQSNEQLLDVLICRRADGRELSFKKPSLLGLLRSGEVTHAEEISLQVPDGRSVSALVNARPIRSETGEVDSFVVTLQDMAPLEEMERMRAEFLGIVSHELRAPLATVKGSVATLLESAPELDLAEMTQFFRVIGDQCDNMRELIGSLLDVARIETGSLLVVPEPTDLYVLVDEAKSRFLNGSGREDLAMELEPGLPLVMADRGRVVQVLVNLLSNAAKHSPVGSTIRVSAVRDDAHVAVSVTDQGRGIETELLPHLFRKFSRAEGSGGSGIAGSGLGLAICMGIVEAHGGRIWAHSDGPGTGACFSFTIPTIEETAAPPAASALTGDTHGAARSEERVLAADDDPQALRYIRDALTKAGYTPIMTGDPKDVPRLLDAEKPHLVLLDLMLPETDGIELMRDIQAETDVPVIFVSVYGQDDTIARAFDMGAADYMVKPFSQTELAARIRAALRRRAGPPDTVVRGELHISHAQRQVTLAGQPVQLTPTEYALLYELAAGAGRVLTHNTLLRRVWGPERTGEPWLVREVIKRLRRKLGESAGDPAYIFTESGVGYRMPNGESEETLEEDNADDASNKGAAEEASDDGPQA